MDQVNQINVLDTSDLSRPREGEVAVWVRASVWTAAAVTLVIVAIVPRLLHAVEPRVRVLDSLAVSAGIPLLVALLLVAACVVPARISAAVRVAVMLPVLHLALMIGAWVAWTLLSPTLSHAVDFTPLLRRVPLSRSLAVIASVMVAAAVVIARKRRGEWIHALVMIALVDVLVLGIWLPIACNLDLGPRAVWNPWDRAEAAMTTPVQVLAVMLVPPLIVAITYTALAMRRAQLLATMRAALLWITAGFAFTAVVLRATASQPAAYLYINGIPWLVATALLALVAIITMGLVTWVSGRAGRRAVSARHRQHTGSIAAARGEMVAGFEITSWLRGPRPVVGTFEVSTTRGPIPVPAGARLIAPLPLSTTLLRTGETAPALCGTDDVGLSGYDQHATGEPFRESLSPIPSTRGVVVGRADDPGGSFAQLALAAWRPCLAYLIILVIAAAPALSGLGST